MVIRHRKGPRGWIGYNFCDGIGLRARYAYWSRDVIEAEMDIPLDSSATLVASAFERQLVAGAGSEVAANFGMQLQTFDLEITSEYCWGNSRLVASAGMRHASLEERYLVEEELPGAGLVEFLDYRHDFFGEGLTVALEASRSFGRTLAFFVAARGSMVFGDADEIVQQGGTTLGWRARTDSYEPLPILEFQAGVECCLITGRLGDLFLRFSYEGQLWYAAGGPNDGSDQLAFEGFALAVGLNR
jgi:hypothetical protein